MILLLVIGTTMWVGYDSYNNRIPMTEKQTYSWWNNGFIVWIIGCALLWIVVFPYYLVVRNKNLSKRSEKAKELNLAKESSPASSTMSVAEELQKLSELKNQGIITDEEFAATKKKLLNI
jgi:flagellar biosynthesis/type III secretory pathway M-ring protein FliF/YscJ